MDTKSRRINATVRRYIDYLHGRRCAECKDIIDGELLIQHIDHIIPHSRGGESVVFNLEPLCHPCNLKKGNTITPKARRLMKLEADRKVQTEDYFQNTPVEIETNPRLRRPQREAHVELRDHFEKSVALAAMVVLPTGVGKSVLIAIAAFGIARGRILVIAPNLTIKEGLIEKLSGPDSVYAKYGVLGPIERPPRVVVLEQGRVNQEDCLRADIVVTNIQQMQGWLPMFPSDFFDVIIVDEAHHVPAASWQNVNETYPNAKRIYLTATPFRADGQPIIAEVVYAYTLAEAMKEGYVKNVARVSARASEMVFVIEDEEKYFSTDEILEMREEVWFSRGVALSEASNRTIIERAVQLLAAKRKSGVHHQIIAVACSVRHARDLEVLFRGYNLKATYVASEGMSLEERERRIDDFDKGRYDVIVHVGILGEGYDNPNISIAAIFRPYRSDAPYAQFVGRAIRCIHGGSQDDNVAHVVDHVGLNLDKRWDYFKEQQEQAIILRELDGIEDEPGSGSGGTTGEREENNAEVKSEVISGFDVDLFVDVPGVDLSAVSAGIEGLKAAVETLRNQGLRVPDAEDLQAEIVRLNQPLGAGPMAPAENRPDKERQARRDKLFAATKRSAGRLIHMLRIPDGNDLVELIGKGDERTNYEVIIRALNRRLNIKMGKNGSRSRRNDWLLEDFRRAEDLLPDVQTELALHIIDHTDYLP